MVRPTAVEPPTSQLSAETAEQVAAASPTKSPSFTCCDCAPLSRITSAGSAALGGVLMTTGAAAVPPVEASDCCSGVRVTEPELEAELVVGTPSAEEVVAPWPVSSASLSTAPGQTCCWAVGTGVTSVLGGVELTVGSGRRTDAAIVTVATPRPTTPATSRTPTMATRRAVSGSRVATTSSSCSGNRSGWAAGGSSVSLTVGHLLRVAGTGRAHASAPRGGDRQ